MEISKEEAYTIAAMAANCYSEGLLDEKEAELFKRIIKQFPELKEQYSWMQALWE